MLKIFNFKNNNDTKTRSLLDKIEAQEEEIIRLLGLISGNQFRKENISLKDEIDTLLKRIDTLESENASLLETSGNLYEIQREEIEQTARQAERKTWVDKVASLEKTIVDLRNKITQLESNKNQNLELANAADKVIESLESVIENKDETICKLLAVLPKIDVNRIGVDVKIPDQKVNVIK